MNRRIHWSRFIAMRGKTVIVVLGLAIMSMLLFTTSVMVFMMGLIAEQIAQMRFERTEG